ncbi:kinase-regulated stress-responsive transcription factor skn7 [Paramecium bursaria]
MQEKLKGCPVFLQKLGQILISDEYANVCYWRTENEFIIKNREQFTEVVICKHFIHQSFISFQRQLNNYKFRSYKTKDGSLIVQNKYFTQSFIDYKMMINMKSSSSIKNGLLQVQFDHECLKSQIVALKEQQKLFQDQLIEQIEKYKLFKKILQKLNYRILTFLVITFRHRQKNIRSILKIHNGFISNEDSKQNINLELQTIEFLMKTVLTNQIYEQMFLQLQSNPQSQISRYFLKFDIINLLYTYGFIINFTFYLQILNFVNILTEFDFQIKTELDQIWSYTDQEDYFLQFYNFIILYFYIKCLRSQKNVQLFYKSQNKYQSYEDIYIIQTEEYINICQWRTENEFIIINREQFTQVVICKHFIHQSYNSFQRQLNNYQFRSYKTKDGTLIVSNRFFTQSFIDFKNITYKKAQLKNGMLQLQFDHECLKSQIVALKSQQKLIQDQLIQQIEKYKILQKILIRLNYKILTFLITIYRYRQKNTKSIMEIKKGFISNEEKKNLIEFLIQAVLNNQIYEQMFLEFQSNPQSQIQSPIGWLFKLLKDGDSLDI